jgi:hypothetical protein
MQGKGQTWHLHDDCVYESGEKNGVYDHQLWQQGQQQRQEQQQQQQQARQVYLIKYSLLFVMRPLYFNMRKNNI